MRMRSCLCSGLVFILSACIGASLFAQEASAVYASVSPRVVYIKHEIFLDGSKVSKKTNWEELEKIMQQPLLNSFFAMSSGSGFFIDNRGRILTNRHVIEIDSVEVLRRNLRQAFEKFIDSQKDTLTSTQRSSLISDLNLVLKDGRYRLIAMIGDNVLGELNVLAINEGENNPDLALVEVKDFMSQPLQMHLADDFETSIVGKDVFSLGFPLGSFFDVNSKDRVVTMNKGIISAFRKSDLLDIQHSAAISSGNSGGPLVDSKGRVVGINAAAIDSRVGNSLFYAVSVTKIAEFLKKKGYPELLTWNTRSIDFDVLAETGLSKNEFDEYISASNILISTPAGVDIILNDVNVGSGKKQLVLEKNLNKVELNGSGIFNSYTIRRNKDLSGVSKFTPVSLKKLSEVTITTDPPGASVIADGRLLGTSPLVTYLPESEYLFSFTNQKIVYDSQKQEVEFQKPLSIQAKGMPAINLSLTGIVNVKEIKVTFQKNSIDYPFDGIKDLLIAPGDYTLTIRRKDDIICDKARVTITESDSTLDVAPLLLKGNLEIRGFQPGMSVYVDGIEQTELTDQLISLPVDLHSVLLFKKGYMLQKYPAINVFSDNKSFVTFRKKPGYDRLYKQSAIASAILGGVGIGGLAYSLYNLQNSVLVPNSADYDEYESMKRTYYMTGGVSVAVSLSAVITTINTFNYIKKHNKAMQELNK